MTVELDDDQRMLVDLVRKLIESDLMPVEMAVIAGGPVALT